MNTALLTLALVAGQTDSPRDGGRDRDRPAQNTQNVSPVEGTYEVVYLERAGVPQVLPKGTTVTVNGNVLTFNGKDARQGDIRLRFGPQNAVFAPHPELTGRRDDRTDRGTGSERTTGGGPARGNGVGSDSGVPSTTPVGGDQGVYVITQDYLVISLKDPMAGLNRTGNGTDAAAGPDAPKGSDRGTDVRNDRDRACTYPATNRETIPGYVRSAALLGVPQQRSHACDASRLGPANSLSVGSKGLARDANNDICIGRYGLRFRRLEFGKLPKVLNPSLSCPPDWSVGPSSHNHRAIARQV
jgi:hypothetical protein